jgi:bacterioferritin (cytochrome b1)
MVRGAIKDGIGRLSDGRPVDRSRIASVAERVAGVVGSVRTATDEAREGKMASPEGAVLNHLQTWLNAKYTIEIAYRSFADRVKGPWRDSLVDHWHEHAKEERAHAYDLAMKIVALGGDPLVTTVQVPPCTPNLGGFCKVLADLELKAIEAGRVAVKLAGENAPLRVLAEQLILVDAQHLDDLRRMCASFDASTTG